MPASVRLTTAEQEAIRKKCIEINKMLVKQGMPPIRDSELVHRILEKSIPYVELNASGEIVLESE